MMVPSRRLNFIHVPKASGNSVFDALHLDGGQDADDADFQVRFKAFASMRGQGFPNHLSAELRVEFVGAEAYRSYFSFGFVRNPFDRLVSLYEYTRQTERAAFERDGLEPNSFQRAILEHDFDTWVRQHPTGESQCDYLLSSSGELLVDFVGRTERFAEDIARLCRLVGVAEPAGTVRSNTTERTHYRDYYGPEARAVVESRYAADLRLFGYAY